MPNTTMMRLYIRNSLLHSCVWTRGAKVARLHAHYTIEFQFCRVQFLTKIKRRTIVLRSKWSSLYAIKHQTASRASRDNPRHAASSNLLTAPAGHRTPRRQVDDKSESGPPRSGPKSAASYRHVDRLKARRASLFPQKIQRNPPCAPDTVCKSIDVRPPSIPSLEKCSTHHAHLAPSTDTEQPRASDWNDSSSPTLPPSTSCERTGRSACLANRDTLPHLRHIHN